MNTFQLKCFLAVAETLNFAKSAKELNTTQPTITHQIKSLEEELNIKLFNRSTRVVELTAEGQSFIDDAKSMLSIEDHAKLRFSTSNAQNIESITIGCTNNMQIKLIENVICKLNQVVKNFHPIFVLNTRNHLLHLMDTDQIDMMLDLVDNEIEQKNFRFIEINKTKLVGFCKNENIAKLTDKFSSKEKIDFPLIFTKPINRLSNLSNFQLLLSENIEIKNIHFAESPEIAIILAKAGIGVAILPSIYIQEEKSNFKQLEIEDSPIYNFGICYKNSHKPILRTLISIIKTEFAL